MSKARTFVRVARGVTAFLAYLTVREWVLAQAHPSDVSLFFAVTLLGWAVGFGADGLYAVIDAVVEHWSPISENE